MKYRKSILTLHKILGLLTGIVVFIVAITGSCLAFKDEIEDLYSEYKKVTPQNQAFITVSEAKDIATKIYPDNTVHGTVFSKNNAAVEVLFYDADPEFYQSIFINPYSGEIIQIDDHLSGFFAFALKGHMRLWLPKKIGEQVVSASIMLFIIIIISGFLLWLPKKRKGLKKRLKFDWKESTKWKRKNFDLHAIFGFYSCSFALALGITGVVISYDWLKYVVYISSGGDKIPAFIIPKNNSATSSKDYEIKPIDLLIPKLIKESPKAESFELHYPKNDDSSIYVEVSNSKGLFYDSDFRFFDQNTLEEIETKAIFGKYKDAKFADKLLRMNYDIHIGAIGGITGKIIAFFASLLIASLPVTGGLLWYGKKYKKQHN